MGGCSEVDPIVASFLRGAVGVITSLMIVELNNVKQQKHKRYGTNISLCGVFGGLVLHMIL